MRENKNIRQIFLGNLGLARKAGKAVLGSDNIYEKMSTDGLFMVIVSSGASDNTKKKLKNRADYTHTDIFFVDISVEELGKAVGKELASCVGISDKNFKNLLSKSIESFAE